MAESTDRGNAVLAAAASDDVVQLSGHLADSDVESARAAKRELWKIVRRAGRPSAEDEARTLAVQLAALLEPVRPSAVLRELLWMLSEIGAAESVTPIATMLAVKEVREDARMSLERIPGPESLSALQSALGTVPDNFKINIVQSLRARGETLAGYPCQKLTPTKQTRVTSN